MDKGLGAVLANDAGRVDVGGSDIVFVPRGRGYRYEAVIQWWSFVLHQEELRRGVPPSQ